MTYRRKGRKFYTVYVYDRSKRVSRMLGSFYKEKNAKEHIEKLKKIKMKTYPNKQRYVEMEVLEMTSYGQMRPRKKY